MNRDERDDLLAGYLGNELLPADRKRFEDSLAADPAFADEVAALRRTLAAMRSLDEPMLTTGSYTRGWMRMRSPFGVRSLLRYAAVVLLAFGAGYAARSFSPSAGALLTVPPPDKQPSAQRFEQRFAQAYGQSSADSELARSLIALSRATR